MSKFHLPLMSCKFLVLERKNTLFVSALGQGRDEPRSSLHSSLAREPSRLSKRPSSERRCFRPSQSALSNHRAQTLNRRVLLGSFIPDSLPYIGRDRGEKRPTRSSLLSISFRS